MKTRSRSTLGRGLWMLLVTLLTASAAHAASYTLEGQNKGNTNTWSAGNLQDWQELDFIPCRVRIGSGPVASQSFTITFPHLNGTTPGFENLYNFVGSSNVVFLTPPTLSAPVSGNWSYTFTVKITNSSVATVQFYARLAAGAHLNPGSSLALSGNPSSMGNLQVHKPAAGPGAPDLAIKKSGPASAAQGGVITYTLSYTNKSDVSTAVGAQVSDIIPAELTVITDSLDANAHFAGNTIFWDLTNVAAHASGQVTFQAQVGLTVPIGRVITNFSQVLSSENDASYADNTSTWLTTVTAGCVNPPLTCVGNKSVECGPAWTFDAPATSDSSAAASLAVVSTVTNALCGNTYSATRTWTATDACGNTAQCSQTVTVIDTTAPVITCVGNKTVEAGSVWTFDAPTANDSCGTNAISIISTVTNSAGACGNTFSATRTWTATDACGNTAQCSQTVTVVDTTAPTITCVASKSVECGAAWIFDVPNTTDGTVSILSTTTNALCGNTFSATRMWKATDACGNAAQCSQTVTVVDTTAPVITCVGNKTVEAGAAWTFDAPTANDGCGTNAITILSTVTNTAGACGNTFSATRTWKATDACGNSAQCSQTVTVVDTTAPTITCVANKSIECGAAWTFDAPSINDGTLSIVSTTTNALCGNTFSATRTWKATDACNNEAQCSQTVTVVDTTAPVISCVANKIVETGAAWTFDAPTANDSCGTNAIVVSGTVTNSAGACGNTFSATRTWTVTDACGNTAQCGQTVTVVDTTAPVITCVANKSVECGAAWNFDAPSINDGTLSVLSTTTNALCGNTFSATRTWKATDACGNAAQCSQTVTVVDTTAPVISCVANKTIEAGVAWTFDAPTANDGCGTNVISIVSTVTNTAGACGNTFVATRTWKATDACGNAAQCSQTVTIVDTTAPTITCVANKSVECGAVWTFDAPAISDGTLSVLSTTTNALCGNTFSATRTWKATDACGNAAQCSQTVTVVDTTAPVISCVANKTVEAGAAWTFNAPTANDSCGTNAISIVSTVTNTAGACGNTFSATRTWKATDACGNTAQCSQTVTIVDTTAPTITCVANKSVECGAAWTFDAPSTSDGTLSVVSTTTNALCGNTFSATRTWKATDACGNAAQCSQTVTVVDTTAPVISCVANKIVEAGATWNFDAPTANDGCGTNAITIVSTTTNVTCGNTLTATRTWKATDACGNAAQCSQTVTVNDTTAPTITCVANKSVECGAAWNFDAPTISDGTLSVLSTTTNALCGNTFSATRTWKATDACGNAAQCSQTVTVVDTTAPVISCVANKTIEAGAAWNFDAPTANDSCGTNAITIVSTTTNVTCGNTLTATRTWKATDACGNTAQCSQTVTVNDTTAPTITCVANKSVECGAGWNFDVPTINDGTLSVVSTTTNALCGNTFSATRTWKATDACGNTAQCSQTVTVVDTTAPVISCVASKTIEAGAAWSFDAPTANDSCGTNAISIASTVTNTAGACGNTFSATRTWKATDACGNTAQCSQTITIVDTTAPVITCVANKSVECGAAWNFDAPTISDGTLSIVGTTTNALCGNTFSATRTWKATDACGNEAQCSQTVTVVDTTAPVISCVGNKAVEAGAAWTFNAPTANDGCGTNAITTVSTTTNVTCGSTFSATRTWKATDACGNSAECSQTVTVVDTTAPVITCVANKSVDAGNNWQFDAPTVSEGTLQVVGTVSNYLGCSYSLTRTWEVSDACGNAAQCSQTVTINDTTAPTVTLLSPTNGTTYIAPGCIKIVADVFDGAGPIQRVGFYFGTNFVGEVTNGAPYMLTLTNVPAGNYELRAIAIDKCGNAGVSTAVVLNVLQAPPLTITQAIKFNPQTGLLEQKVRVSNPTLTEFESVRVYVQNLTGGATVWNKSGTTNGVPYVQSNAKVQPGSWVDFVIEYYVPNSGVPTPTLRAESVQLVDGGSAVAVGVGQNIVRGVMLSNQTFLLEINSVANRIYYVQYTSDLKTWKTAQPAITGNGSRLQWVDNGLPKTESAPSATDKRFYRVIAVQ